MTVRMSPSVIIRPLMRDRVGLSDAHAARLSCLPVSAFMRFFRMLLDLRYRNPKTTSIGGITKRYWTNSNMRRGVKDCWHQGRRLSSVSRRVCSIISAMHAISKGRCIHSVASVNVVTFTSFFSIESISL
ncbi:MAG: hypothetical protein BWY82_02767 [Verrucomicrobia bacterium ADurb.Bin474]|nr:MAG: hypothetical protein BWY82_02767 [Verrucomicrobia bacterium ADurb.Bin474]